MTTPSAEDLAGRLQRFGLQRDRMRAALARQAGISATDLDALEHLEADGPLTQRDLGQRLSLTSGAVTMLVDRLERAGWVHRRPHPGDRRYVLIELSPLAAASAPEGLAVYHARSGPSPLRCRPRSVRPWPRSWPRPRTPQPRRRPSFPPTGGASRTSAERPPYGREVSAGPAVRAG